MVAWTEGELEKAESEDVSLPVALRKLPQRADERQGSSAGGRSSVTDGS